MPPASARCRLCLLLAAAWMAAMAGLCYVTWPHLPLDMSPVDPSTIAAYRAVVLRHVGLFAGAAFGLPLIVFLAARASSGRNS